MIVNQMSDKIQYPTSPSTGESICTTVVTAVAEAKGVDPMDLNHRLNDVVDPDALERIFQKPAQGQPRTIGEVNFTLADCEVTVAATGQVTVSAPLDSKGTTMDADRAVAGGPDDQSEFDG